MEQQEGITVEKAVFELLLLVLVLLAVCLLNPVTGIVEHRVHLCTYEEVWYDIVAFRHLIAQTHARFCFSSRIE